LLFEEIQPVFWDETPCRWVVTTDVYNDRVAFICKSQGTALDPLTLTDEGTMVLRKFLEALTQQQSVALKNIWIPYFWHAYQEKFSKLCRCYAV